MARHLVQKQIMEFTLAHDNDFQPVAGALTDMIYQEMLPKLATQFDQLADADTVISIDRIEVDLGVIQWGRQQAILSDLLVDQIIKSLHQQIRNLSQPGPQLGITSAPLRKWQAWLHYVRTGLLPWFEGSPATGRQWEKILSDALESEDRQAILPLIRAAFNDPVALHRLTTVFSSVFIDVLVTATNSLQKRDKAVIYLMVQLSHQLLVELEIVRKLSWETLLLSRAVESAEVVIVTILDRLIRLWPHNNWIGVLSLLTGSAGSTARTSQFSIGLEGLYEFVVTLIQTQEERKFRQLLQQQLATSGLATHFSPEAFAIIQRQVQASTPPSLLPSVVEKQRNRPLDTTDYRVPQANNDVRLTIGTELAEEPYSIYVSNAGLVLVSPFLLPLFKATGLVIDREFSDEEAQVMAVRLTGYLATNRADTPDWELPVAKVLCGLSPSVSISVDSPIPAGFLEEGNQLLDALISHWPAIGKTSPAGLREGFLNRPGKLNRHQDGWLLDVESQTIDILLSQLPWNYGLIKLPWMPHLLTTNW